MALTTQQHLSTGGTPGAYTGEEIKEGVMQIIYQISPEDTPLLNIIGRKDATNTQHEWLVRARGARAGSAGSTRAVPAGSQFNVSTTAEPDPFQNFNPLAVPVRVPNFCEIFRQLPYVDETTLASQMHGVGDIMADQIEFYMVDFAITIEERFWNGAQNAGTLTFEDTVVATQTDGVFAAITSNSTDLSVAGTVDDSIDDAFIRGLADTIWAAGGRPQDMFTGPNVRGQVDNLSASDTKFLDSDLRRVIDTIGVYEMSTQIVMLHLSRDVPDDIANATPDNSPLTAGAVMIDRSFMSAAWLRPAFLERLPRMGGTETARIEGQVCLEYGNEAAHGELVGLGNG